MQWERTVCVTTGPLKSQCVSCCPSPFLLHGPVAASLAQDPSNWYDTEQSISQPGIDIRVWARSDALWFYTMQIWGLFVTIAQFKQFWLVEHCWLIGSHFSIIITCFLQMSNAQWRFAHICWKMGRGQVLVPSVCPRKLHNHNTFFCLDGALIFKALSQQ